MMPVTTRSGTLIRSASPMPEPHFIGLLTPERTDDGNQTMSFPDVEPPFVEPLTPEQIDYNALQDCLRLPTLFSQLTEFQTNLQLRKD